VSEITFMKSITLIWFHGIR